VTLVYCGHTEIKLGMMVEGLGPATLCQIGTQLSSKGAQLPNFRPMSVVAKRLDGLRCHALGTEVGLSPLVGPGQIVFDGDPLSPCPKGPHHTPQLSAKTAEWIRMSLGMEV